MPNWIEGTIKLRGNSEDLKRFFQEGLDVPNFCFTESLQPITDFVKCVFEEYCEVSIIDEVHIKGTRRAFIQKDTVYWDESYSAVALPIKQAWAFCACEGDCERWAEISKKYNLDIRLYGFEKGMEFCEEVEIIKGKITMNNEIKYDDWVWECPMPLLGG